MKTTLAFVAALALALGTVSLAEAAPCRDAKGKFTKCPVEAPKKCRDAKGKFAKCGTPGAKPA